MLKFWALRKKTLLDGKASAVTIDDDGENGPPSEAVAWRRIGKHSLVRVERLAGMNEIEPLPRPRVMIVADDEPLGLAELASEIGALMPTGTRIASCRSLAEVEREASATPSCCLVIDGRLLPERIAPIELLRLRRGGFQGRLIVLEGRTSTQRNAELASLGATVILDRKELSDQMIAELIGLTDRKEGCG